MYVYALCVCVRVFIYICTNWLKTINKTISHNICPHFFNGLLIGTHLLARSHMHMCTHGHKKITNNRYVKRVKICAIISLEIKRFRCQFKIYCYSQNILFDWTHNILRMPGKKICHHTLNEIWPKKERTRRNVNWNRNIIPDLATITAFYFLIISNSFLFCLAFIIRAGQTKGDVIKSTQLTYEWNLSLFTAFDSFERKLHLSK